MLIKFSLIRLSLCGDPNGNKSLTDLYQGHPFHLCSRDFSIHWFLTEFSFFVVIYFTVLNIIQNINDLLINGKYIHTYMYTNKLQKKKKLSSSQFLIIIVLSTPLMVVQTNVSRNLIIPKKFSKLQKLYIKFHFHKQQFLNKQSSHSSRVWQQKLSF